MAVCCGTHVRLNDKHWNLTNRPHIPWRIDRKNRVENCDSKPTMSRRRVFSLRSSEHFKICKNVVHGKTYSICFFTLPRQNKRPIFSTQKLASSSEISRKIYSWINFSQISGFRLLKTESPTICQVLGAMPWATSYVNFMVNTLIQHSSQPKNSRELSQLLYNKEWLYQPIKEQELTCREIRSTGWGFWYAIKETSLLSIAKRASDVMTQTRLRRTNRSSGRFS